MIVTPRHDSALASAADRAQVDVRDTTFASAERARGGPVGVSGRRVPERPRHLRRAADRHHRSRRGGVPCPVEARRESGSAHRTQGGITLLRIHRALLNVRRTECLLDCRRESTLWLMNMSWTL